MAVGPVGVRFVDGNVEEFFFNKKLISGAIILFGDLLKTWCGLLGNTVLYYLDRKQCVSGTNVLYVSVAV